MLDSPGLNPGGGDTPVQTSPGVHPTSHTMGTGCFPGLKRLGHGIDEVKARVELYIPSHSGPLWPVIG